MAGRIKLIHPIYLDVPMLVSFAAAVEGGVAFGKEVTREQAEASTAHGEAEGSFGFSALFSKIFDASVRGQIGEETTAGERSTETESRGHTEASVAILLYDRLTAEPESIIRPNEHEELISLEPGALVELTGTIEKNAVDTMIDYIDAVDILSNLSTVESLPQNQDGGSRKKGGSSKSSNQSSILSNMRDTLDKDRKRTPISNVLFRCSQPEGCTAVVTLRTENLRDLTLSELHKNTARLVGKVTRVISDGESMSAFENYGMSLMQPEMLHGIFLSISSNKDIRTEFSEVEVQGPAVQVLPPALLRSS